MWKAVVLLFILLATFVGPFLVAAGSVLQCLSPTIPKRTRLVRIVTAYFASILSAAGVYYALAIVGDYNDAQWKYVYYTYYPSDAANLKSLYNSEPPPTRGTRSFNGITERLFSGVDWEPEEYASSRRWSEPPVAFMVARAKLPKDEVIQFLPDARVPVFLDCLHLSVVTSATVGYGDVYPINREAKLATDAQIVLEVILLVIVLGMFFSGWWER